MNEGFQVTVKTKTRITKYAAGETPNENDPFEVLENEEILTGEQAKKFIERLGGGSNAVDTSRA